jgi:hypothetical protein
VCVCVCVCVCITKPRAHMKYMCVYVCIYMYTYMYVCMLVHYEASHGSEMYVHACMCV